MTVNEIPSALPKVKLLLRCERLKSLQDIHRATGGYFGGFVKEEVYTSLIASWLQFFFGNGTISNIHSSHQVLCGSAGSP